MLKKAAAGTPAGFQHGVILNRECFFGVKDPAKRE
jgi:hypothetical protein